MLGTKACDDDDNGGYLHTRACAFCNITTGVPSKLDPLEPEHVAVAVAELGLAHVVITSVDRDDLDDGGAGHFAEVIRRVKDVSPTTTIEILTPDFQKKTVRSRLSSIQSLMFSITI